MIGAAQILESFQLRSSSQPVLIFLYTDDLNVPYFVHPVLSSLSNTTDVFVLSHDVLHPSLPKVCLYCIEGCCTQNLFLASKSELVL